MLFFVSQAATLLPAVPGSNQKYAIMPHKAVATALVVHTTLIQVKNVQNIYCRYIYPTTSQHCLVEHYGYISEDGLFTYNFDIFY